jgi:acetyl-CoA acetyltransferase
VVPTDRRAAVTRVAVVGVAYDHAPRGDGRNDAELLAPVVDAALDDSGLTRDDIGVVCSAGSEFLNGVVGSVMGAFDGLPGWPPRTHTHLEGDGAFACYEAWIRLLAGEATAALVCAYSRPLADDPARLVTVQLDPYLVAPLAPDATVVAALQARALLDAGRYGEADLAQVVASRRSGTDPGDLIPEPYVASPLRDADCPTVCAGAAAVVLAVEDRVAGSSGARAWITGIEQRVETGALGARDLTVSPSTSAAAASLGVTGSDIDVLEVHARYSHEELILVDAIGARSVGALNRSGGALVADPQMATGLVRVAAAAEAVRRGDARRAVAHATNGPCLQHNLVALLEREA